MTPTDTPIIDLDLSGEDWHERLEAMLAIDPAMRTAFERSFAVARFVSALHGLSHQLPTFEGAPHALPADAPHERADLGAAMRLAEQLPADMRAVIGPFVDEIQQLAAAHNYRVHAMTDAITGCWHALEPLCRGPYYHVAVKLVVQLQDRAEAMDEAMGLAQLIKRLDMQPEGARKVLNALLRQARAVDDGLEGSATATANPVLEDVHPRRRRRQFLMTAAAAALLILALWRPWQADLPTPPVATSMDTWRIDNWRIDNAVRSGDVTVLYSVGADVDADTQLVHVHLFNTGDTEQPAPMPALDTLDTPGTPTTSAGRFEMVPARSIQHRVVRVRKDRVDPFNFQPLGGRRTELWNQR